jgi:hypothetical protein
VLRSPTGSAYLLETKALAGQMAFMSAEKSGGLILRNSRHSSRSEMSAAASSLHSLFVGGKLDQRVGEA